MVKLIQIHVERVLPAFLLPVEVHVSLASVVDLQVSNVSVAGSVWMHPMMGVILMRAARIAQAFAWRPMMNLWSVVAMIGIVVSLGGVEKTAMMTNTAYRLLNKVRVVAAQRVHGLSNDVIQRRIIVRSKVIHHRLVRLASVRRTA